MGYADLEACQVQLGLSETDTDHNALIGRLAQVDDEVARMIDLKTGRSFGGTAAPLARQVAASFLTTQRAGHEPQVAPAQRDARLDGRVAEAIARLEARLDDPEPVARIARAVGVSVRRLESLFHQYLGESPGAYALGLRLQAARRMVTDTRHPLAEVALRTGFASPSTLSRAFSRRFGVAPSVLRRRGA